jgi:hypothetical protein
MTGIVPRETGRGRDNEPGLGLETPFIPLCQMGKEMNPMNRGELTGRDAEKG